MNIFHMFSHKSLEYGAKVIEIIYIADYKAHGPLLEMLLNIFNIFPNTYNTKI